MWYWNVLSFLDQNSDGDLEMEKDIRDTAQRDNVVITDNFNYPSVYPLSSLCLDHDTEAAFLDTINDCVLEQSAGNEKEDLI